MKCKEASTLLVRSMFDVLARPEGQELDEHLRACERCRLLASRYRLIRDEVAGMEAVALPPEGREALMEGLSKPTAAPAAPANPPAHPRPESPALHRALFFTFAMLGLGLVMVGLLVAFRGELKPVPVAARVSYSSGAVQARTPGSGNWHEMPPTDAILPGTALHTETDGLLALASDAARWWMDGSTALAVGEGGQAELAQGRVCVRCTASEGEPARLVTTAGTVTCAEGEFVAEMSGTRLKVACTKGAVGVGASRLEAGQQGVVADGELFGPVRNVRTAALTHWLARFRPGYGEGLTPRRLASVPLAPERPALPGNVSIARLDVDLTARGPLVLVRLAGRVRNDAPERCQVELSTGGLLLPRPLATTGPQSVDLPGGGEATFALSAVCVLTERAGRHVLALNPLAWTRSPVGRLTLHVDAAGERGLREVSLPAQEFTVRRKDAVDWSWSADRFPAEEPLVLDMELAKAGQVDALRLSTPQGNWALCAWRPDADDDAWVRKGRRVLLAFDATADFGPSGAAGAQDVMDVLLGAIPPAVPTALVAYDGGLRLDRSPWAANLPPRVESLLASLWRLEGDGQGGHSADFLARALELAAGAQGEKVLIYLTGAGEPADAGALDALSVPPDVRLLVVQIGAARVADAYGRLCARSGGAALALDPDEAPRLGGFDLLVALQSAAVRAASMDAPGGKVLSGPAALANAPVVGLVRLPADGQVAGEVRAEIGGRALAGRFGRLPGAAPAESYGAEAQALVRGLLGGEAAQGVAVR